MQFFMKYVKCGKIAIKKWFQLIWKRDTLNITSSYRDKPNVFVSVVI